HGCLGRQMLAAIGKGVRCDINNPHDQRSLSKFERTAAEVPCKDGAHGSILSFASRSRIGFENTEVGAPSPQSTQIRTIFSRGDRREGPLLPVLKSPM